jgi:Uma2 family endonuclease
MEATLAPPLAPASAHTGGFRPFPISVDLYERMIAAGVFRGERLFLWQGQLVEKMPKYPPHNLAMMALNTALVRLLPAGWHVRPEIPLRLDDRSMPEPDLASGRGNIRDFAGRQATPRDLAIVIEVADSSVATDAGEKLAGYAAAGVPVYWVVDIPGRIVRLYSEPDGPSYRSRRDYGPDEEIPVILDGVEVGRIAVRDVLP